MRFYKSESLTICTKSFLKDGLRYFDASIKEDPTLITEENKILRVLFDGCVDKCILGICFYNSKKMIAKAHKILTTR